MPCSRLLSRYEWHGIKVKQPSQFMSYSSEILTLDEFSIENNTARTQALAFKTITKQILNNIMAGLTIVWRLIIKHGLIEWFSHCITLQKLSINREWVVGWRRANIIIPKLKYRYSSSRKILLDGAVLRVWDVEHKNSVILCITNLLLESRLTLNNEHTSPHTAKLQQSLHARECSDMSDDVKRRNVGLIWWSWWFEWVDNWYRNPGWVGRQESEKQTEETLLCEAIRSQTGDTFNIPVWESLISK